MSILFGKQYARNGAELAAQQAQLRQLNGMRSNGSALESATIVAQALNAGRTPADLYRAFDTTPKIEVRPAGDQATLTRLLQKSRSINIGKTVFEYTAHSELSEAGISLNGTRHITADKSDVTYEGTVIPVFDHAYGLGWRENAAGLAEGYDQLMIDAANSQLKVFDKMNDYLFNGNANISVKGRVWLGLRGDDSVVQENLAVNLASAATTGDACRNEVSRVRDTLRIANNCTQPLRVGVSREIHSNWERMYDSDNSSNVTILDMIKKLTGIAEIYEDSALTGNQLVMYWDDLQGFHPVTGMALSSYAVPRVYHNDNFDFVKWAAVGFVAKSTYTGKKCALYAD